MKQMAEVHYNQVSHLSIKELKDYGELIEAALHLQGEDAVGFHEAWKGILMRERVARMRWR